MTSTVFVDVINKPEILSAIKDSQKQYALVFENAIHPGSLPIWFEHYALLELWLREAIHFLFIGITF